MMSKKKITIVLIFAIILLFIYACNENFGLSGAVSHPKAIPNAARIKLELAESDISPFPSGRTIDSVELVEDEEKKDIGVYEAEYKVFSHNNEVSYIEFYLFRYMRNQDDEWELDRLTTYRSGEWTQSPLTGISEEKLKASIMNTMIQIDDEEWYINEDSLETITISSQDTNLESNHDSVTVNVTLKDVVLSASGQMHVEFYFDDGWQLSDYRISTQFETSLMPHAIFSISDDILFAEIVKHNIIYSADAAKAAQEALIEQVALDIMSSLLGIPFLSSIFGGYSDPTMQVMSVSANEISDLTVLQSVMSEKGTVMTQYSTFILSKDFVDFEVYSQIIYHYDDVNGWILHDIGNTPIVKSLNIVGTKWVGVYAYSGRLQSGGTTVREQYRFTVEITDVTQVSSIDATVNAILNMYPPTNLNTYGRRTDEYSQTSKGYVNLVDLSIELRFDEWIVEPPLRFLTLHPEGIILDTDKINLTGYINIENRTIKGTHDSGTNNKSFELELDRFSS